MKKLFALLLALVMCVYMFACGDAETTKADETEAEAEKTEAKTDETEAKEDETKAPEADVTEPVVEDETSVVTLDEAVAALKEELEIVKGGTVEEYAASVGVDTAEYDELTYKMVETMLKNFDYEMGEVKENGDEATVDVTVTNIDTFALTMAMLTAMDGIETEEEQFAAALAACDGDVTLFTETATVFFVKGENGWAADEEASADFASLLSGIPTSYNDFGFDEDLGIEEESDFVFDEDGVVVEEIPAE